MLTPVPPDDGVVVAFGELTSLSGTGLDSLEVGFLALLLLPIFTSFHCFNLPGISCSEWGDQRHASSPLGVNCNPLWWWVRSDNLVESCLFFSFYRHIFLSLWKWCSFVYQWFNNFSRGQHHRSDWGGDCQPYGLFSFRSIGVNGWDWRIFSRHSSKGYNNTLVQILLFSFDQLYIFNSFLNFDITFLFRTKAILIVQNQGSIGWGPPVVRVFLPLSRSVTKYQGEVFKLFNMIVNETR